MIDFIRTFFLLAKPTQLFWQTGIKWNQNRCSDLAAALAYYALFSLFPLLLIVLSVVATLIGPGSQGFQIIEGSIREVLPAHVHALVRETLIKLYQSSTGAGLVGLGLLLFSASTVFTILRNAVNHIWQFPNSQSSRPSLPQTMLSVVINRLLGFLLVLGTALLLFAALMINIFLDLMLSAVANLQELIPLIQLDQLSLAQALQGSTSLLILVIVVAVLFKILPGERVAWKDIGLGALLTALLLKSLQHLVSNSIISVGSRFLSYGVIGSVMILLLWIYLTCAIFLLGCQFSWVYATLYGSRKYQKLKPPIKSN